MCLEPSTGKERWKGEGGAVHGGNGALVRARNSRAPLLCFCGGISVCLPTPLLLPSGERERAFVPQMRICACDERARRKKKNRTVRVLFQHHKQRDRGSCHRLSPECSTSSTRRARSRAFIENTLVENDAYYALLNLQRPSPPQPPQYCACMHDATSHPAAPVRLTVTHLRVSLICSKY